MKVFLIGANGQIGKHIVKLLKESNKHTLKAMVRSEEQSATFKQSGVYTVVADLEGSMEDIAKAMSGSDAVIFTAGSGGKTGADKTLTVDLDGAVKSIEAAKSVGANRFMMVSAFRAFDHHSWKNSPIKHYMVAKHYADRILAESDLNYTILGPGALLNEPGTGNVSAGNDIDYGSISREDVAKAIVTALDEENTYRKTIGLMAGETPIEQALKEV